MDELVMTITTKGQVTIPVQVRKFLGVKPQDRIIFRIKDGKVELQPVAMTLDQVCGAVPPLKQPLSDSEMHDIVDEERAERWLANNP